MSSDDIVVHLSNIGKCYEIYDKPSHRLWQMISPGEKKFYKEFWALNNVSLKIKRGESLGIIGRNGSGKSTLLQIIAGTLTQTTGVVDVKGRIAALLELGSGFNPEFTGRENVYMNASILGLTKEETDLRFDEITDFADIGEFIDQPVKSYSSGMMLRLAFAVSTCVDPDVLIIDEALAVGDMKFQVKCFDRIRKFKENGGVVLLVSHDLNTINKFCEQTCYLKLGNVHMQGNSRTVTTQFYNDMFNSISEEKENKANNVISAERELVNKANTFKTSNNTSDTLNSCLARLEVPAPKLEEIKEGLAKPLELGDGTIRIIKYGLYDISGQLVQITSPETDYFLHIRIVALQDIEDCSVGFVLRDHTGIHIYSTSTRLSECNIEKMQKNEIQDIFFKVCIPRVNFPYFVGIGIAGIEGQYYDFNNDCIQLKAESQEKAFGNSWMHVKTKTLAGHRWQG